MRLVLWPGQNFSHRGPTLDGQVTPTPQEGRVDVVLDFERPVVELRRRIDQLRELQQENGVDLSASIAQLEVQASRLQQNIFGDLSPWQRTLLARHPARPYTLDYIDGLFDEWTELHGDRAGFDDHAIVGGTARFKTLDPADAFDGTPVMIIGHQKGRNTKENLFRNFGMARPDGYRKALRLMRLAERFSMPIVTFIDTPGAYPGIDAEARGQAEAIARNIMEMSTLKVPVVAIVIGEGGSGGALAIGVANRVMMLENSVYSVISPEGCAAILWRDRAEGPRAAEALRITASNCEELGAVDEVIPEMLGGAHRYVSETIASVGQALRRQLADLQSRSTEEVVQDRYDRFRRIGKFETGA
ncbi:MAG: acetyl-CoA carboxylase carboxyltransferase subunit alpha [Myxococcales bacterium]|nr:acetyl-CoA carboxylase carboxyltransferase subunit alpha [Myxococcales bacterium]